MRVEQFIKDFNPGMSEYCPLVICADGNVFESTAGHLQTLIMISGDAEILSKIPSDVSPLLYLAAELGCMIVDYENQIFLGDLSEAQSVAYEALIEAGLISRHPVKMTYEHIHL